ncbi:NADH:flavin oxidoreductase/NADH oxidase [Curvibacter sp. HBC61]|uniref:NADH:flavin oxidoreductase/NADH oxidase n=1 Tax=Curvibacter cyanobacteriorum TaxID=3026422 RepID=A0ABT5MZL8_9BURK|nr:NADH:flavin oxidoreductase/NADH oxidase [Curvibacter sp. HBC61]MDD0838208.1 NADH:flavin oxidoreductase/NADH oxidase [Curvibacter sp. HBC61]
MARLFTPYSLRGVTARNRVVISPMQTSQAHDGLASDWHLAHLTRFAMGGAGTVFVESTAVEARGRNNHGDLGLWQDEQVQPLARVAEAIRREGAVPAIQLGHTGRKASTQKWWRGNGALTEADAAQGEPPWLAVAPSALPVGPGWPTPQALGTAEVEDLVQAWGSAARRAREAGFQVLEIHGAHGYLIHQFLSPLANQRTDRFGQHRLRFALDVAEAVRQEWPEDRPLFWRVSLADVVDGGLEFDEMVDLLRSLKDRGVDVVDCSSGGGISSYPTQGKSVSNDLTFRAALAARLREASGLQVMGVGLVIDPRTAEGYLGAGQADLIGLGREALYNPNWPLHAEAALSVNRDYASWPQSYRMHLLRRAASADALRPSFSPGSAT